MLAECLAQIYGYRQLIAEIESVRKISYDSENKEHEEMLLKLWDHLMLNEKLKVCFIKK